LTRAARAPPLRTKRITPPSRRYQIGIIERMAMTLRLTDEQAEALRSRANREGRSMQQVARSALDDYLMRAEDDEQTDRLAEQGAQRFAELLRRLGE
jgi:plasmid stability protein